MTLTMHTIETQRFGTIEIGAEETIRVVEPMPGFGELEMVALIPADEAGIFVWFQSATPPDVAFLAVNPFLFHPGYDIELGNDAMELLEAEQDDEVVVYTFVTIRDSQATANLAAPFIVNARTRRAMQVILDGDWPMRAPLDFRTSPAGTSEESTS